MRAIAGDPQAAAPLDDGTWVRFERDGRVRIVSAEGDELGTLATPAEGCSLEPWSTRAFVRCDGAVEPSPEGPFGASAPRLARFGRDANDLFASRDGRSLTRNGPCRRAAVDLGPEASELSACTLSGERPWRTWTAPAEGFVIDVFDSQALIAVRNSVMVPGRPRSVDWSVRRYDIDHATWLPLVLAEPTARWVVAGFTREGRVAGLVEAGGPGHVESFYVLGDPARAVLRSFALPRLADDVATLRDETAVFTGPEGPFLTLDGVSFRALSGDGGAATSAHEASAREGPRRPGARVRCADQRCAVDGRWAFRLPSS